MRQKAVVSLLVPGVSLVAATLPLNGLQKLASMDTRAGRSSGNGGASGRRLVPPAPTGRH